MNLEILQGAVLGALAGLLVAVMFMKGKKRQVRARENHMSDENEVENKKSKSLIDRWSVKLSLFGIAMGIFTAFGQGVTSIGFIIGFAIPYVVILGGIGLVVDFFRYRKK